MKMYEELFAERLAQLRTQKGVSARDMSLSMGQSESYINKIENRASLPSMGAFFFICEYLGVTPAEFFDDGVDHPLILQEVIGDLKGLSAEQLAHIHFIVKDIKR